MLCYAGFNAMHSMHCIVCKLIRLSLLSSLCVAFEKIPSMNWLKGFFSKAERLV